MNTIRLAVAVCGLVVGATSAQAAGTACYENPRTNALTCYEPAKVKEKDGIRSAPVLTGGPKGVRRTQFEIHVNCATGVAHLKDRDGVSFAGGQSGTPALDALRKWICEEPLKKR